MADKFTPELGQIVFGTPNVAGDHDADWATDGLRLISCAIGNGSWPGQPAESFANDVFEMHPYWWGEPDHEDADRPNFVHKPTGLEISWYKRIGRGMSGPAEREDWPWIVAECIASVTRPSSRQQREGGSE